MYICNVIKNKEVNMIILNYKNFKGDKLKLKNVPTKVVTKFYLTKKETCDIKVILTKKF